jgi:Na+/phosphate symporter
MENKVDEVCLMCNQIRIMLKKVEKGFLVHSKELLEEADKIGREIDAGCVCLTDSLVSSAQKSLVPLPSELERIGDSLESIIHSVSTKIKDGIMFSDKAVKEIESLFEGLAELLECLHDCLKTKNRILISHIIEQSKELSQLANDYSYPHQERLIAGVCSPKASPIYLDIVDSLRNIAMHISFMTERLKA